MKLQIGRSKKKTGAADHLQVQHIMMDMGLCGAGFTDLPAIGENIRREIKYSEN